MRLRRRLSLAVAALAVGGVVAVVSLALWHFDVFRRAELGTVDARFALREDPAKAKDVVIVGVDAHTLSELDVRPPLRRRLHARLIDRLRELKPRVIAYDFQFTERSDGTDDQLLAQAVFDTAPMLPMVFATVNVERGRTRIFGSDQARERLGALAGNATVYGDSDGIFRHIWHSDRGLESFAVVAAEQALHHGLTGPAYPAEGQWIDFAGGPDTIRQVSFSDVLDGHVPAGAIRDKVVVVGATDPTFQDVHPVATSGRLPMSGPELQANAIQSLMRGSPLDEPAAVVSAVWIVLWSLIGALGPLPVQSTRGHWLRPALLGAAITFGSLAGLVAGLALAFSAGWILPATYAMFGFVVSAFWASSLALARTRSEVVRNRFSRFVPEQAVDAVMAMSGQKRLEPAEIEATVMFIDMRGFSSHTEHRSARDTIDTLNQYLTIMSEGLLEHGATVVSYMGDGIMAVFGAPLRQEDHADRALEAARELVGPRLAAFNAWLRERAADWTAVIGIGIHSGPVASGMVGSERRLEYAAVGDTTNTAARLESATKELGVPVLLSDATRAHLMRADGLEEVATIAVKGREQQVRVWTLPETTEAAPSAASAQRAGT